LGLAGRARLQGLFLDGCLHRPGSGEVLNHDVYAARRTRYAWTAMPLRHVRPFAAACTLALASCQPHEPVATYTTEEFREPCVSYYTDSDEVASRGTLVQLDVTLRYRTTNTFSTGSGNGATQVEAEAVVEASSSQLACRWDRDGGAAYYEVRRDAVDGAKPFPGRANGTARLSGFNETRA